MPLALKYSSSLFLCYLPSPNLGLTPQGLTSQMPVGLMPVGGATVSGPEQLDRNTMPGLSNVWVAQCQGHRQRQHRTDQIKDTHPVPGSSSSVFCPKTGPSLQAEKPRMQFCRRQVFHRKLRNQGCSFTRDLLCAVTSRCFPYPTLSLAYEQTLKDPRGTNEEVRGVDLANWALWTSHRNLPQGLKHQFHQGFWADQRSGNLNQPSLPVPG